MDNEYESRYLFPTSRRQANPLYHGAQAYAHSMGMEMIHLGIIELVKVNLGIGIQIGIIQAGMTNWDIESQVIKVLVEGNAYDNNQQS